MDNIKIVENMENNISNKISHILDTIDNDDNIYYNILENENDIIPFINILLENAVLSLYVIHVYRENLFDKLFINLQKSETILKHRFIFLNINLPKISKIQITIDDYKQLIEFKFIPNLNNLFYKYKNRINQYIYVLNIN